MNQSQENRPTILNVDKSRELLTEDEAFFLLNHERHSNIYGSSGSSLGKSTPFQGNYKACDVDQPLGENYSVGEYRSPITNEAYSWIYNSNGVHYIQRINGEGNCEIIYDKECLKLSADPRHKITDFRAYLKVERVCSGRHGKYLIWVDGNNDEIFNLDVEASIATSSFTTAFFDRCQDECSEISLCVPKHCGCIEGEFIPLPSGESSFTNQMVNIGIKFMFRQIYYDLRASEWSDISKPFYQDSKGCFDSSEGFSRCLKLRLPLGNPMVDKTELAYSVDNGNTWMLYDTIEKYEPYSSVNTFWYQRPISSSLDVDPLDECFFFYIFCNNKQPTPIDKKETSRAFNPFPRQAQGIIPVKGSLGFYNYKKGNCPISLSEVKKLSVSIQGDTSANCEPKFVSVTVRAVIIDRFNNRNQFIRRDSGRLGEGDDLNEAALFGGVRYPANPYINYRKGFDQTFQGRTSRNFIVYIEGTEYAGEMIQYWARPNLVDKKEVGTLAAGDDDSKVKIVDSISAAGGFYFQEYTFRVPKGTKGFLRLSSHHFDTKDDDSSTFVCGILPEIYTYTYDTSVSLFQNNPKFEIYFDACEGNVDLHQAFVIADGLSAFGPSLNTGPYPPVNTLFGAYGYVKINNSPVEGIQVFVEGQYTGDPVMATTDHNGFYHFAVQDGITRITNRVLIFKAEQNCGDFVEIHRATIATDLYQNVSHDVTIASLPSYANNFLVNVNAVLKDCNGVSVGGVPVAVSGSKYKITDASGQVTFQIRNNATRNRDVTVIIMDKGGCFIIDCFDQCNPCMQSQFMPTPACFDKASHGGVIPTITMTPFSVKRENSILNRRGLKKGGRYGFAAILESPCGKLSASYDLNYIDVPKFQSDGKLSFKSFSFAISGTMTLPFDGCLKILRTENQNPFELQWVVDKAERVDGKIKLTIQSLNDYNASFNFKTNTVYKYLDGDRVEFIKKNDGSVIDLATYGLLNYKTLSPFNDKLLSKVTDNADFFNQLLIIDDGRLDGIFSDLKGTLIEIQRNKQISTTPSFFETCTSVPVVNGHPQITSGNFETFDSYLVTRSMGSFTHTVEHHSPSDFWGERLTDTGRFHAANKYENEMRVGRGISLNAPNQTNYFGDLEKVFDAPEQGDIVGMSIKDGKIILAIGENDNFLAQAANDLVRVGGDGIIRATPADAIISDAEPKVSGAFGCRYEDVGGIYFGDGFATWPSPQAMSYIKHDYNSAVDVAENKVQSFFRKKMQDMRFINNSASNILDHVRFSTGYNHISNCVYITIKSLRDPDINNERSMHSVQNETIAFSPKSNDFLTFTSFTAEGYSLLDIPTASGCAFVSFSKGIPYIHTIKSDVFNEFYGVVVDRVVGFSVNKFRQKRKCLVSIEIHDEKMWYVHSVTTAEPNYFSEIPPIRMERENGKWSASFLGNRNSREGLYGRDRARGFNVDVVLVRDNTDNLKYGTFDSNKRKTYDELDMILTKLMVMEQSGMTENV